MPASGGSKIRVVLIEDVPELRELVRYGLETDPAFEVVGEAEDPVNGLALIEAEGPDAVMLDISMPRMSGFEAIPRVLEAAPGTAVAIFSALSRPGLEGEVLELGAHALIGKGVPMAEIRDRVRTAVASARETTRARSDDNGGVL